MVALAVGVGALAQALSGIGFALVSAPFVVAAMGPRDGVRTVILLSALLNLFVLVREHRGVLLAQGALLLLPAALATPPTAWLVHRVSERVLTLLTGVLVTGSAVALACGLRLRRAGGVAGAMAAGALSGAMNVIGGIGGPAAALYALNAGWPPLAARATLQACFVVVNAAALAVLGLPPLRWTLVAAVLGGWLGGTALAGRVDPAVARRATLALACAGGAVAVARAVAG